MTSRHLVIMAAGTGGHIIPGLAVAEEMQRRGWTVSWLGTSHGMENKLVPPSGISMDSLQFSGLRGKGLLHTLKGFGKLLKAFVDSAAILRKRSADAVLGMGGYVCFPGGLMAWLLRRPLMLVNADASLLMSNSSLRPFARRIGFGFDGAAAASTAKAVVTGNPVRSEIEAIAAPEQRYEGRHGPLRVLVVGGSLGAQALNDCLPKALALWPQVERPWVTHQTGAGNFDAVNAAYAAAGVQAEVIPFIDDMAKALTECDLVVCRAGAVTVSELCAAGVPAVLVPLVVSTTSHQRDNARFMAQHGAAIHLPQNELSPQRLFELLSKLDRSALTAMGLKAHALARPRAAARVADEIEKMIEQRTRP
ncbi:undecaprenyldiphospho-muramoylpentapeptide beta-N-acetylglucosaminyltransferase [Roseateles toxinivorans]|uniref:UDP-N-acetylglucosamine--N-acetylmuramyl-(pentapeptide) pyrophosphoryl-undecaprenol N-acetylglucosamine transferase n=1 Tax=Roseateles toxinivorans TaxID=270368 RepID=A0A4R6QK09_9BURK|nr:undecaprenyldiphospho-muramoylpentapeptide beta-N-acetylglucosaminyltransferase [Roseateles toxinivorans]TDP63451.1 UDP-N-acetylglucosamine-N-acetylmuramylpentapeptide N-acetylglucosamine transferase [Roseateles toxinivorans]